MTKKDNKKIKPFLDKQKKIKKGFSNTVSQKKNYNLNGKRNLKKCQKWGSQTKPILAYFVAVSMG